MGLENERAKLRPTNQSEADEAEPPLLPGVPYPCRGSWLVARGFESADKHRAYLVGFRIVRISRTYTQSSLSRPISKRIHLENALGDKPDLYRPRDSSKRG